MLIRLIVLIILHCKHMKSLCCTSENNKMLCQLYLSFLSAKQLYKIIYSTDIIQLGKFGKQTLLVKLE